MDGKHHAPRLLIIGLDGCTYRVLDPLLQARQLEAIGELCRGGRRAVLRSTVPPLTPVAWSSMLTGVNPGKHGVFGFLELDRKARRARLLNGGDVRAASVWQMLSAADVRVGVFNVPWTYPPQQVNGFMISGFDAPAFDERMFHPRELYSEVVSRFGRYSLNSPPLSGKVFDLRALERQVELRGEIASWLIDRFKPDVFMVVFTATDYAQHHLWGREDLRCNTSHQPRDLLAHTYQLVDSQVGRLIADHADGDTTVLLVSDHGARLLRAGVDVNRWLASLGMLVRRAGSSSRRSILKAVGRAGYRLLRVVPGIQEWARRWKMKASESWVASLAEELDWERTQAVCVSEYGGVALLGDEEKALEALRNFAGELTDPATGETVFGEVLESRAVYSGPYVDRAPQVWLVPRDYEYLVLTNWRRSFYLDTAGGGPIVAPPYRAGHDPNGIVVVAGADAQNAQMPDEARIEDVGATILAAAGLAPPPEMDGRPLIALPEEARRAAQPAAQCPQQPAPGEGYTAEEQEKVEQRLRDLGYL